MTAQQVWWTLNHSQVRSAGIYFQVIPKQHFHLHQTIGIMLGLELFKLINLGREKQIFPLGSACQMLVCSFQRARPINKAIIQEGAREAEPKHSWQRVWHFTSLLLSIHLAMHGEILHSGVSLCASWPFGKGTTVFWEKGQKADQNLVL